MIVSCVRCHQPANFAVELPVAPGKTFSAWCSQACLLEWEVDRLPNVNLASANNSRTRMQSRVMSA